MKLYLLRHAAAREAWPDPDRSLSDFGIAQAQKLAALVDPAHFENVAQIWHSPYTRAAQTAQIFRENAGISAPFSECQFLTPESDPRDAARMMASLSCFGKDLIAVSHNPFLERLVDLLLEGSGRAGRITFGNCTLAGLSLECEPTPEREFGEWSLEFLVSPKLSRL